MKPLRKIIEGKVVAFSPKVNKTPDAIDAFRLKQSGSKVLPFTQKTKPAKMRSDFANSDAIKKLLDQLRAGEAAYLKSKNNPKYPIDEADETKQLLKQYKSDLEVMRKRGVQHRVVEIEATIRSLEAKKPKVEKKPPLGHETLKAALKASLKVTPKKEK